MKILVTGGAGFVGSHLCERLISKGHQLLIVDNLHSGKLKNLSTILKNQKITFFKTDIRNFEQLKKIPKTDAVIHLAAIASVVSSVDDPQLVNDVNVSGTLNMLEFCKTKKIRKFIFISSAAVYGDFSSKISENVPFNPLTVYGATKTIGEYYCRIYSNLYGINSVILRPFNIYGPRQNNAYAGVISKFYERIILNKSPIIFGDGSQTRDFIHVSDIVTIIIKAISLKTNFDIFNLGSGKSITISSLAKICLKISNNKNLNPIHKKSIPGVVHRNSCNNKKLVKKLRIKQFVKLENGLTDLFQN